MFDVRLTSLEPRNGADPAAVLVRVFQLEVEESSRLAETLPRVVKRGVSREYAEKLVVKLAGIGARAEILPAAAPVARSPSAARAAKAAPAAPSPAAVASRRNEPPRASRAGGAPEREPLAPALLTAPLAPQLAAVPPDPNAPPDPFADMFAFAEEPAAASAFSAKTAQGPGLGKREELPVAPEPAAVSSPATEAVSGVAPVAATYPAPERSGPFPAFVAPPSAPAARSLAASPAAEPNVGLLVTSAGISATADSLLEERSLPLTTPRGARIPLPVPVAQGAAITARAHVWPGTKNALGWAAVTASALGLVVLAAALVLDVAWLVGGFVLLLLGLTFVSGAYHISELRSRGIAVSMGQLPEIQACAKGHVMRLGASVFPRIFVTSGSVRTLRSCWWLDTHAIELDQAFVAECLAAGCPELITFQLGREIARHALGHTRPWRKLLAALNPWLARSDVLSADRVALELCGDRNAACAALAVEAAGPGLLKHLDYDELERAAERLVRERGHWFKGLFSAERRLLHRIYALGRSLR